MVSVSYGCECMNGTRGSGVVSSSNDVNDRDECGERYEGSGCNVFGSD